MEVQSYIYHVGGKKLMVFSNDVSVISKLKRQDDASSRENAQVTTPAFLI